MIERSAPGAVGIQRASSASVLGTEAIDLLSRLEGEDDDDDDEMIRRKKKAETTSDRSGTERGMYQSRDLTTGFYFFFYFFLSFHSSLRFSHSK